MARRPGPVRSEPFDVRAAYDVHGAELYRFVLRQLGDGSAAEDVVQEIFLRAWRAGDSYDPRQASLRTWLFSIARNTVIDEVRRSAARPWQRVAGGGEEQQVSAVPADEDRLVDGWIVKEALLRIGEDHRDVIVQTHLRERPYAEVAAELGIPVGTVRSRVFYGLKALRTAMQEMGVEP